MDRITSKKGKLHTYRNGFLIVAFSSLFTTWKDEEKNKLRISSRGSKHSSLSCITIAMMKSMLTFLATFGCLLGRCSGGSGFFSCSRSGFGTLLLQKNIKTFSIISEYVYL